MDVIGRNTKEESEGFIASLALAIGTGNTLGGKPELIRVESGHGSNGGISSAADARLAEDVLATEVKGPTSKGDSKGRF